MSFQTKLYRGKHSKYNHVVHDISSDNKILFISSAWGDTSAGDIAIKTARDYYLSAQTDREQTSPYPLSRDLSLSANHLKIAIMLANEKIYKDFNQDEYTSGVEIMAMAINQRELNVAYVGGPSLVTLKDAKNAIPYIGQQHMAYEFKASSKYPLPKNMLGVHLKKNVSHASFRVNQHDQFYIVYADHCPTIESNDNLDILEKKLLIESERPYWLAEWKPFT